MKKFLLTLLFLLMFALMTGTATAISCAGGDTGSMTINCPVANDYMKGVVSSTSCEATNQGINVSVCSPTSAGYNITFVHAEYRLSTDTDWTAIGRNGSSGVTQTNGTRGASISWDTTGLDDESTYQLRITPGNLTANQTATTLTLRMDNSAPLAAITSAQTSNSEVGIADTWTWNVANASSCTVFFGVNQYEGALSGSDGAEVCTFSGEVPESSYSEVYAQSFDGLNLTTSTILSNILVSQTSIGAGSISSSGASSGSGGGSANLFATQTAPSGIGTGISPLLIIAAILLFVFRKSLFGKKK